VDLPGFVFLRFPISNSHRYQPILRLGEERGLIDNAIPSDEQEVIQW
jgi:hypothetical protein